MRLRRDNLYAHVLEATDDERGWLKRVLKYTEHRGRGFNAAIAVYDNMSDRFPAGLLPTLGKQAVIDHMHIELEDARPAPLVAEGTIPRWLDAEQLGVYDAALKFGRGIIHVGTGGGKTEVAVALGGVAYPKARVLYLAPRAILAIQARERWQLRASEGHVREERMGLIAEGERSIGRVTFGTFQTVHKGFAAGNPGALQLLGDADIVMADECQTVAADTFYPVLMACSNARQRWGFSATPLQRGDGRSVMTEGALGPVIARVTAETLIASGRIVDAEVQMHALKQYAVRSHPRDLAPNRACACCAAIDDEPCLADCPTMDPVSGVFPRIYQELVVESTPRNQLIVDLVRAAAKPALVFVQKLEHGRFLTTLLTRAGTPTRLVTGAKTTPARKKAIKELERGEIEVIVATSVFEAGVDIPTLRTVANAGAGMSPIRTVQILGRVLRGAEGKHGATMLDVLDQGEPSLERHAHQRRKAYRGEGFTVTTLGA